MSMEKFVYKNVYKKRKQQINILLSFFNQVIKRFTQVCKHTIIKNEYFLVNENTLLHLST